MGEGSVTNNSNSPPFKSENIHWLLCYSGASEKHRTKYARILLGKNPVREKW